MKKYRLLFLSGGSLVGQNILTSLNDRRDDLELIVMNSNASEPAIYEYDLVIYCDSLTEKLEEFEIQFHNVLRTYDPDIIIPCRDEDVAFLCKIVDHEPRYKYKVLCGESEVANAMLDKELSFEFSLKHDLPFAPAIKSNESAPIIENFLNQHGFPVIAKPKRGFASRGVRLLTNRNQLAVFIGRHDYIFQRYLGNRQNFQNAMNDWESSGIPLFLTFEETKISIQACIGPKGHIGGILVTEHIMKQGKSEVVTISSDHEIQNLAREWVKTIALAGWRGPLNIQSQRDQSGDLFIYEYNGRFTGATSARVQLGFDEVGITLGMWLEGFPSSKVLRQNEIVFRTPVSRVLEKSYVDKLLLEGEWRKSELPTQP